MLPWASDPVVLALVILALIGITTVGIYSAVRMYKFREEAGWIVTDTSRLTLKRGENASFSAVIMFKPRFKKPEHAVEVEGELAFTLPPGSTATVTEASIITTNTASPWARNSILGRYEESSAITIHGWIAGASSVPVTNGTLPYEVDDPE